MSIQLAAKHLAAHGRGPDTTLVHMTPGEVASLQSLAQQHGGSLSINPQTGLPEAGFLSALLPMAAGAGLAAMGMPAGYAALSVGAASAATNGGDLRKGLMAGISAYGGAGMAESFMGAGLGTMGGAMGAPTAVPAAAPATVLEAPVGATSPYALTGSPAASSTAKYSLGESSSFLNKPLPSLVSTAPAQAVQAAAAATPAAQAAQQAAALNSMSMGQRFDALKAGATGTNAMNYIKANPFTSLGVATAAMTPDETSTPQKAADTDRGPRAKLQYYSGYGTSLPAPNMQGIEQTYNRPYYAAKGGVTRMATGGITSAPRNQQQLFADYLQRVSSSGAATTTPPTNKYDWWKNPNDPTPAAPAPAETAEEYAARTRVNARGGGGGGGEGQTAAERAADNAKPQPMLNGLSRDQYFSLSPEEQKAVRAQADMDNPKTAALLNAVKFVASPGMYVLNALRGPEPASEMQKYIDAADAESRTLTRDRAYEAYGNNIEGVTASDAAAAEAQRVQAEATEKARMERDIAAADPFSGATPTVNYSTGLYNDLSAKPDSYFPAGTAYTDKAFTRDAFGRLISPDGPYTGGATTSSNTALTQQNAIAGSAFQRALNSVASTTPEAAPAISPVDPYAFGMSLSDNNDSVGRGVFGYSVSDNNDSVGRGDFASGFGISRSDNLNPTAEAEARAAANAAAMTAAQQDRIRSLAEAPASLAPAQALMRTDVDTFGPVTYSAADEADRMFAAPDITPSVPGAISADPNADKKTETLGIPSAETFAAMIGPSLGQYAAVNNGVVSDAGVLGGVPAPNMGNTGSIRGSYGIGGVWTNKEGMPIRTGDGSLVMTGAGAEAMQRAVAESNEAANRTYGNAPEGRTGRDATAGDGYGGGYGSVAAGYTGGSEAAAGGLSTPYGFQHMAQGGISNPYDLGSYSDGGRLLKGPGDGVSDSIPATIGKGRPARLADGEFVIPARIVSEIGNGSTEAGARKLYAMMDRIQAGRKKSVGKGKVAVNSRADRHLPA